MLGCVLFPLSISLSLLISFIAIIPVRSRKRRLWTVGRAHYRAALSGSERVSRLLEVVLQHTRTFPAHVLWCAKCCLQQKLLHVLPRNSLEGWSMGQQRPRYILGGIQDFLYVIFFYIVFFFWHFHRFPREQFMDLDEKDQAHLETGIYERVQFSAAWLGLRELLGLGGGMRSTEGHSNFIPGFVALIKCFHIICSKCPTVRTINDILASSYRLKTVTVLKLAHTIVNPQQTPESQAQHQCKLIVGSYGTGPMRIVA